MGDWLTIAEASKESGYSSEHLRDLMREGRIKARKFATVWQVNRVSLLAYLREQQAKGEKRGRKTV
ncbi:MAG: helix-turn-helix domain-containing protein [Chloroflexota bacterium]|nr:helix-turn-helix domain-containing protein [Chloroflexota bacterium]